MAITNTEAIKFTGEIARVKSEQLRGFKAEIDSAMAKWHNGIGTIMANDLEGIVEDGRAAEGVTRVTGNDVVLVISKLEAIQTILDAAGVMAAIEKLCVRTMRAAPSVD